MAVYQNYCSSGSHADRYILRLTVDIGSQSTEGNYTSIRAYLQLAGAGYWNAGENPYGSSFYGYTCNGSITVYKGGTSTVLNTSTGSSKGTVSNSSAITIADTGWFNVSHNNDGTMSLAISGGFSGGLSSQASGGNVGSGTFSLNTIPRASDLYNASGNIGEGISISLGKKSNSFLTTLVYEFGTLSDYIVIQTPQNPISWTVPESFYTQIPNSSSGTGTLTAYTYTSGGVYVGYDTATLYINANPNASSPSVEITSVVDTNDKTIALTRDNTKLVKHCSTALVSTTRSARYSSSVRNLYINNVDVGTSATTRSIANVDTNTFNATVYDTRGFSSNATPIVKDTSHYVEYVPLTLSIKKLERHTPLDNQVVLQYEGNYFNDTFGAKSNSLVVRWKYREVRASTYSNWTILSPTIDGNSYSQTLLLDYNPDTPPTSEDAPYNHTGTTVFDYTKSYEFVIEALDKINDNGEVSVTQVISQGIPVYWWNKDSFNVEVPLYAGGRPIYAWKFVGSVMAPNRVSLPDDFEEVYVVVDIPGSLWGFDYLFPRYEIVNNSTVGRHNGTNNTTSLVLIQNRQVLLSYFKWNGSDYTAHAKITVYCR